MVALAEPNAGGVVRNARDHLGTGVRLSERARRQFLRPWSVIPEARRRSARGTWHGAVSDEAEGGGSMRQLFCAAGENAALRDDSRMKLPS